MSFILRSISSKSLFSAMGEPWNWFAILQAAVRAWPVTGAPRRCAACFASHQNGAPKGCPIQIVLISIWFYEINNLARSMLISARRTSLTTKGVTMFKRTVIAGLTAAALGSGLAPAAEPASPHTITGNVGLFSQYIFRGLTQTNEELALQGGFDYAHSGGFYAGTWGSNVSVLRDSGAYSAGGSL